MRKLLSLSLMLFLWTFMAWGQTATTSFPLIESFDGVTFPPTGWTTQKTAGTGTPGTWDRQTAGTNPTCSPHSGAAMTRYNCYNLSSGTKGTLITPSLQFDNDNFRVKFWMYRDNGYTSNNDLVNVYYNTSNSLTGATLLGTINRCRTKTPIVATDGWYEYSYNMPVGSTGSGRYIIFEGVSAYGNNMFLDDVTIEEIPTL
ncbi:MAG TPA: choice-of-anchor J domain-containing protein [Bacteroidales bacterium]|nr:choice-of-anchor J domain-containing protein [Bacteroidales bacterium]